MPRATWIMRRFGAGVEPVRRAERRLELVGVGRRSARRWRSLAALPRWWRTCRAIHETARAREDSGGGALLTPVRGSTIFRRCLPR